MKKLNIFKKRSRGSDNRPAVGLDTICFGSTCVQQQMQTPDYVEGQRGPRSTLTKPDNRTSVIPEEQATTGGALEYSCQECGRVFDRVKSRSAHMKTHRQQERECLTRCGWPLEPPAGNLHHQEVSLQDSDEGPVFYRPTSIL